MKSKYEVRTICRGFEIPFRMIVTCEESKEEVERKIRNSYVTGFNLKEEEVEIIIKEINESDSNEII